MRVEYVTTTIQAAVTGERDNIQKAYDRLPDAMQCWGMIDLVQSANFRLEKGPKEGYVRAETFFGLVRASVAPCTEVRVIKEMGDAVLLVSERLRAMFECVVVIDQVAAQMAAIAGAPNFPFAVRGGIGFGTAKRLLREEEDFVGHPIDRLARIMNVRSESATIVLDDEAFRAGGEILGEYASFLQVSESIQLSANLTKGMTRGVYYRELRVDRPRLLECEACFLPWRERSGAPHNES